LSTGQPINNGNKPAKVGLDATKFGEGIAILNGELFQLTWKNKQ
jgi:glutamine cyclotransferase